MKFWRITLGLIITGMMIMWSPPAWAQYTTEPFYTTLKVLYSNQTSNDFKTEGSFGGSINKSTGVYNGDNETSDTFGGGLALGYDFGATGQAPVRVELEYLYRAAGKKTYGDKNTANVTAVSSARNTINSTHTVAADIHSAFINVFLDFRNDTGFIPYVGGGLGVAYVNANLESNYRGSVGGVGPLPFIAILPDQGVFGKQNSINLAWNAGAGLTCYINPNLTLDLGYRYSDYGETDFGTTGYNFVVGGAVAGDFSADATTDFKSHEVILGLRFTGR